jgi:hypothetical protein
MVNQEQQYKDGFDILLKTQSEFELPAGLEDKIMHRIEVETPRSRFNINISSIVIIGFLSSLLICLTVLAMYYDVLANYISDIKLTLLLAILVYTIYEANLTLPSVFYNFGRKKKHTHLA